MTTDPRQAPEAPSPAEVAAKIAELQALSQADPEAFSSALATNVLEPDPVETAAFRSEELVFESALAAKYLIEHSNEVLRHRRRGSRKAFDTRVFQMKVGQERRRLDAIVAGIHARNGRLPTQPNPRRRAERRLVQENLKGPVPKGRFIELLNEEVEKEKQAKRDRKRARAQARKQRRND